MNPSFPVAIGGVGGSGTRVIAWALERLGYFMGHDLNHAHDNLSFTLLFKHRRMVDCSDAEFAAALDIFNRAMSGGDLTWSSLDLAHIDRAASDSDAGIDVLNWCAARAEILKGLSARTFEKRNWAWKEPNTHMLVDRLFMHLPQLKYIHVRRNGLDMAYSNNQRQLMLWGEALLGVAPSTPPDPAQALAFWCAAERRFADIVVRSRLQEKVHVIDFDQLCIRPDVEWRSLIRFLGCAEDKHTVDNLVSLVIRPDTKNRRVSNDNSGFSNSDLAFVRSLHYI